MTTTNTSAAQIRAELTTAALRNPSTCRTPADAPSCPRCRALSALDAISDAQIEMYAQIARIVVRP